MALLVAGAVFLALAAATHIYIFVMESITWTSPSTWRRFGIASQHDADIIRPMAYNQGWYNAFLAVATVCGIVLAFSPDFAQAGLALEFVGGGSMVLAATVLVISTPALARAAVLQGALPLIGIVLTAIGLLA